MNISQVPRRETNLGNVHSARWLEAVVADGLGLISEQIAELILLDTLFSHAPHHLVLLLQAHSDPKTTNIVSKPCKLPEKTIKLTKPQIAIANARH